MIFVARNIIFDKTTTTLFLVKTEGQNESNTVDQNRIATNAEPAVDREQIILVLRSNVPETMRTDGLYSVSPHSYSLKG